MKPHSKSPTIEYYDSHSEEYIANTVGLDMADLYKPFLELLPKGGKVLDAGCGSGRDAKLFIEQGCSVLAVDASESMVKATSRLTAQSAKQLDLRELDFHNEFDGIWACASLLHIPLAELDGVLTRFEKALRFSGVIYLSFKEGDGEREDNGRHFLDITESFLLQRLERCSKLSVIKTWVSADLRVGRTGHWVNGLLRKVKV